MIEPTYDIGTETWDRMRAAGRVNPVEVARVHYRGRVVLCELKSGNADPVAIRRIGSDLVAVVVNHRLGYAGAQCFNLDDVDADGYAAETSDVFAQSDPVAELGIGDVFELADGTLCRRFHGLLCELAA